jgi:hypothetical protein
LGCGWLVRWLSEIDPGAAFGRGEDPGSLPDEAWNSN